MTKDVLAIFGVIFIIVVMAMLGIFLYYEICEKIDNIKRAYRIKHRFDKPAKAKCYCVDCVCYNNTTERCEYHNIFMHDAGFCWRATPRKKEIKE